MVYYLKYRPQIVDELDNKEVAALIKKYLSRDSIPHAFLFTGGKGTGKTSTARIVAKSLNCESAKVKGIACGTCDICKSIAAGANLDILEIDAASNRGIDEIRDLREKIKLSPLSLIYKVYIIDEAHMLTTEAFNALLKTLEEPPKHAVFILATTEVHKIPDTIMSRCVRIHFSKARDTEILTALERIVRGEKLNVEKEALMEIAQAGDGSFRDATKLLEEVALETPHITRSQVQKRIGATDIAIQQTFLEHLHKKNTKELLDTIQTLTKEGKNVRQFFFVLLKELELLLISQFSQKESTWKKEELLILIKLFAAAFSEAKTAVLPTIPFELAVLEYTLDAKNAEKAAVHEEATITIPLASSSDTSVSPFASRWNEFLEKMKPHNNSITGVLRSCRPTIFKDDVLTIEAAYKFHADKLSDPKAKETITQVLKDMMGSDIKVQTVIRKRN